MSALVFSGSEGGVSTGFRIFGDARVIHIDWDETDVRETGDAQAALDYTEDRIDDVLDALDEAFDLGDILAGLQEARDKAILYGGPSIEVVPRCDICNRREDHEDGGENDWNGETGNHISCEQKQR